MKSHLEKINNHKITRHTKRILKFKLYVALFILLPIVVFTLLSSKTDLIPNTKSFVVLTGSMEPTLPVGSITYTQKSDTYSKGDVISFKNESDQTVTHRVTSSTKDKKTIKYTTKGDANKSADSTLVPADKVIGKVMFTIPHIGKAINFLQTRNGFILAIILPTIFFIFLELWNIKKEIEKITEEKVLKRLQGSPQ